MSISNGPRRVKTPVNLAAAQPGEFLRPSLNRARTADPGMQCDALIRAHPRTVAVLYARADSVYKTLPETDVYDFDRDARTYDGPWPVVAHPPCRAWGGLRHLAKPRADEKNLARLAVALVREFGGVLEHPATSTLWPAQMLPEPGETDAWGGWTLTVWQWWWGHRAQKATRLYICGTRDVPPIPYKLGDATHVIAQSRQRQKLRLRPEVTKAERERTPMEFAIWLCDLARRCVRSNALLGKDG